MDISVDNVMEQKSERGKIHESWFVMLELLTKATQTKAFVLSAFFIMGLSLCWKVEKALETTLLTVKKYLHWTYNGLIHILHYVSYVQLYILPLPLMLHIKFYILHYIPLLRTRDMQG